MGRPKKYDKKAYRQAVWEIYAGIPDGKKKKADELIGRLADVLLMMDECRDRINAEGLVTEMQQGDYTIDRENPYSKIYDAKATLQKLGKIRGANEKKPLYEITFTDENNGKIKEGGTEVTFSILSDLADTGLIKSGAKDVMIYGQMKSVDMPLWGNFEVKTDEGGDYFKRNMMGIRGLQTAGAGVTRLHTVQVINNKANP